MRCAGVRGDPVVPGAGAALPQKLHRGHRHLVGRRPPAFGALARDAEEGGRACPGSGGARALERAPSGRSRLPVGL